MVKTLNILPKEVRKARTIKIKDIPVCHYKGGVKAQQALIGDDGLVRILRDMMIVREFETMLDNIKREGHYHNIAYNHKGPAHLSIGQEAAAVGQAFLLGIQDHIYGSHRSHGEILAKGLSAIDKADQPLLQDIMNSYFSGEIVGVVDQHIKSDDAELRAIRFLLYGTLAEVFGKKHGFNRGLGGSMHAFFPPFGIYPNNAIVGGSGDIAPGAALYKKVMQAEGIVVCNIGDASMGCGPVWEGINFAGMAQFSTLWEESRRGGLPIIFFFMNNFYGMGGQTRGETMAYEQLAQVAAGLNADNYHTETVDGNDPLAVVDAMRRKMELLADNKGPILLDVQTYRQSGHSPSDASSYRTREEMDAWKEVDPIVEYSGKLMKAGVIDQSRFDELKQWVEARIEEVCRLAVDETIASRLDLSRDPEAISRVMYADTDWKMPDKPAGELSMPLEETSRYKQVAKKARFGVDESGKVLSGGKAVSFRDGLWEAIAHHFVWDNKLVAYGEENRDWDGAFAVYRGLTEMLPYHRLFNSPISEGAIVGTSVGYALEGGHALVELMYADFMGRAGDEIFNQLSKWQSMSAGILTMPVVLRISVGSKYGAQHSQDWGALVAHIPGLKVVFPATPYDAKGLMAEALSGSDPVVFFESQKTYDAVELFHTGGVPTEYYRIPIGEPDVKRQGKDLTILTVGATLYTAIKTADRLRDEFGLEAEVIDARSLVPFNYEPVIESVKKTGRILLASDACERASFLNTFATNIQMFAFDYLDAPVAICGAKNWITPCAEMEEVFFPQPSWLLDVIHTHLEPLKGYVPTTSQTVTERIRCAQQGV